MSYLKTASFVLICGLLTGCTATSTTQSPQFVPDDDMCGASQFQNFVGRPLTVVDEIQFTVPVRTIPEYSSVTMDFNLHRLNFYGDKDGTISRVYCG